ncbi:MAG: 30S ribosome-binding factor RbfA [Rhodospirillales bacterium]
MRHGRRRSHSAPGAEQAGPSQRQLRVGEMLRHVIAGVIERGELRDPQAAGIPVTVTEVRVSPDMRTAIVFVVPLGGRDTDTVVEALRRAAPFLRRRVAEEITLKFLPALKFEADTAFDHATRIDRLLRETPPSADDDDDA